MFASLLQHFAIAAVLALIAAVLCRVTRPGPAARHAVWLVVLIKLAMPPVVVVRTPWAWPVLPAVGGARPPEAVGPGVGLTAGSLNALDTSAVGPGPAIGQAPVAALLSRPTRTADVIDATAMPLPTRAPGAALGPSTAAVLGGVWMLGTLLYLALQVVRIARLRRWLQGATPPAGALVERMEALARRLDLPVVPVRVVQELSSPLIWCMRRPMLLWPADLPADLSDTCRDGLIVHELAHVRRRDHWVSWIELLAGALGWWNPLFWYVRTQVREHAELACDAHVIQSLPHGRRAYAEALVAVCDIAARRPAPVPSVGVSTGSRRVLERRLVMIMRGNTSPHLSRVASIATAALIVATVPVWAQRAPAPARPAATAPAEPVSATEIAPEPQSAVRSRPPRSAQAVTVSQTLPSDAQRLIARFEGEQAQIRREADARLAQQRNDLVHQLESLQDSYTKAGRLDDATAIRDRIRLLESGARAEVPITTARPSQAPAARHGNTETTTTRTYLETVTVAMPDSLTEYRDRIGDNVSMTVTGRTDGTIWGSGVYTDDSSLSTAAVHAGVLREGETKTVTVKILPGRDRYDASRQNGVRSQEYGDWGGSYRIESVSAASGPVVASEPRPISRRAPAAAADNDPAVNLAQFRDHVFESFTIDVVGNTSGSVWGSDIYTDDSSIAAAAVHAGVLKPGERGTLKVTLLPGQTRYSAVTRNGVMSLEYGSWEGSFRLERVK